MTFARRVAGQSVSRAALAFESDFEVDADVVASAIVRLALVAAAQPRRLVLRLAAVVDSVADAIQPDARPVAALELFIRIARTGSVFCNHPATH